MPHSAAERKAFWQIHFCVLLWGFTAILGKLITLPAQALVVWRMLLVSGYRELPVTSEHTVAVNDLPPLHKDPFDRILVAQARVEGLTLLTADKAVAKYGDGVRKV